MIYRLSISALLLIAFSADACTGVRTFSSEGDCFRGRTMEFAAPIPGDAIFIPRGQEYSGTTISGEEGMQWETRYAAAGAGGFGLPHIIDGVNEEGLSAAVFYFANYVGYPPEPEDKSNVLAPYELVTWILTSFATVEEVRDAIGTVSVSEVVLDQFGFSPPLHYLIMDSSGDCIVVEHINGQTVVYDNPLGIITNSPEFSWHMTNLNNYVDLSPVNFDSYEVQGVEIREMGMGSGLLGIPGDFTPPSRFLRAFIYSANTIPCDTPDEAVLQVFHILNQFDIPLGASRKPGLDESGNLQVDYTLWSSVTDLSRKRYYIRTYENSEIRMIDLQQLDPMGDELIFYSLGGDESINDITENGTPGSL